VESESYDETQPADSENEFQPADVRQDGLVTLAFVSVEKDSDDSWDVSIVRKELSDVDSTTEEPEVYVCFSGSICLQSPIYSTYLALYFNR
jgi:hypothetical protein